MRKQIGTITIYLTDNGFHGAYSTLGKLWVFDRMRNRDFSADDIESLKKKVVKAVEEILTFVVAENRNQTYPGAADYEEE